MHEKIQPHRGFYRKLVTMTRSEREEITFLAKKLGVTARDLLESAVCDGLFADDGTEKPVEIVKGTVIRL